eukprot:c7490_g1_i2.p1 GENE.c7490_g1_i2~~c7490_g1_i2.p1  ORF type:complete len:725 (-),score=114.63 c7490_g1_i2:14-2095(-)
MSNSLTESSAISDSASESSTISNSLSESSISSDSLSESATYSASETQTEPSSSLSASESFIRPSPTPSTSHNFWTGRYIKISNRGVLTCLCTWDLYEIEIWFGNTKISYSVVSASSVAENYPTSQLYDGNTGTLWAGDPVEPANYVHSAKVQWVILDLHSVTNFNTIRLYQALPPYTTFNIDSVYVLIGDDLSAGQELAYSVRNGWNEITPSTLQIDSDSSGTNAACNCTSDGLSGSTQVPMGCSRHNTTLLPFCYTQGGLSCLNGIPSTQYPNSSYVYCYDEFPCTDSANFVGRFGTCQDYYESVADSYHDFCDDDGVTHNCSIACGACVPEGCPSLLLTGLVPSNPFYQLLGTFVLVPNRISGGRPVYSHKNNFLYYLPSYPMWFIGPTIGEVSGYFLAVDAAPVPELISIMWVDSSENHWHESPYLRLYCIDTVFEANSTDICCAQGYDTDELTLNCLMTLTEQCESNPSQSPFCSQCGNQTSDLCNLLLSEWMSALCVPLSPLVSPELVSPSLSPSVTPSLAPRTEPSPDFRARPATCERSLVRECCYGGCQECQVAHEGNDPPDWCETGLMMKFLLIVTIIVSLFGFFAKQLVVVRVCGELMCVTATILSIVSIIYYVSRSPSFPHGSNAHYAQSFQALVAGCAIFVALLIRWLCQFRAILQRTFRQLELARQSRPSVVMPRPPTVPS